MSLISIDPGEHCGVAYFSEGLLRAALLFGDYTDPQHDWYVSQVVCELPEHRTGSPVRVNDLIKLAYRAGWHARGFECAWDSVVLVPPKKWKGSVDPDIMIERIKSKLSPGELARVSNYGARTHNVWDAIGLGLWHLKRMGVGGR